MVRLPHQREDEERSGTGAAEDDAGKDREDDEDESEDPIEAIFRILEEYYEGIAKREDEGIGVG